MASTISAGTTSGTAIAIAGDTSGNLAFTTQAGANTITVPNSTGTILTTGSPQSSGVIQVVQGTTTTQVNNSTSTYADTGLTATITPKFSTSTILVIVNHPECYKSADNAGNGIAMKIVRGSTQIAILGGSCGYTNSTLVNYFAMNGCVLDSPATTSATTYKTQFKNSNNGATCAVQLDTTTSAITLMEIAA